MKFFNLKKLIIIFVIGIFCCFGGFLYLNYEIIKLQKETQETLIELMHIMADIQVESA